MRWEIFSLPSFNLEVPFYFDKISVLFFCSVLFIYSRVSQFSQEYIAETRYMVRFSVLVRLFVLSIVILIFRPRLISILLG